MENFCINPICRLSWRIIIQSLKRKKVVKIVNIQMSLSKASRIRTKVFKIRQSKKRKNRV